MNTENSLMPKFEDPAVLWRITEQNCVPVYNKKGAIQLVCTREVLAERKKRQDKLPVKSVWFNNHIFCRSIPACPLFDKSEDEEVDTPNYV